VESENVLQLFLEKEQDNPRLTNIHMAHLVFSSTALAFLTNMSEKRKSASLSAIQVKNRRKTIGIEEKSCVIM
jgi:hypothetical protein